LLAVLLVPMRTLAQLFAEINETARRTEEAAIYHWHAPASASTATPQAGFLDR